jgi:hypothetical protein
MGPQNGEKWCFSASHPFEKREKRVFWATIVQAFAFLKIVYQNAKREKNRHQKRSFLKNNPSTKHLGSPKMAKNGHFSVFEGARGSSLGKPASKSCTGKSGIFGLPTFLLLVFALQKVVTFELFQKHRLLEGLFFVFFKNEKLKIGFLGKRSITFGGKTEKRSKKGHFGPPKAQKRKCVYTTRSPDYAF